MDIKTKLFSYLDEINAVFDKEEFPICDAKKMKKNPEGVEYTPLYLYAGEFNLKAFTYEGETREVINLSSTLCIMAQDEPEKFAREFPKAELCKFEYEDEEGYIQYGLIIQTAAKRKMRFIKLIF